MARVLLFKSSELRKLLELAYTTGLHDDEAFDHWYANNATAIETGEILERDDE